MRRVTGVKITARYNSLLLMHKLAFPAPAPPALGSAAEPAARARASYCVHRGVYPLYVVPGTFEIKWVYPPRVATRDFLKTL